MIRGYFIGESPFVRADVRIPRLSPRTQIVELLIDTGSHVSVLQHEVALALGLTEQLSTQRMEASRGFAGELSFAVVRSELRFEGGDEVYRPQLRVAVAPSRSGALPSVLGMDFKASFRLTVSPRDDLLILERRF